MAVAEVKRQIKISIVNGQEGQGLKFAFVPRQLMSYIWKEGSTNRTRYIITKKKSNVPNLIYFYDRDEF